MKKPYARWPPELCGGLATWLDHGLAQFEQSPLGCSQLPVSGPFADHEPLPRRLRCSLDIIGVAHSKVHLPHSQQRLRELLRKSLEPPSRNAEPPDGHITIASEKQHRNLSAIRRSTADLGCVCSRACSPTIRQTGSFGMISSRWCMTLSWKFGVSNPSPTAQAVVAA